MISSVLLSFVLAPQSAGQPRPGGSPRPITIIEVPEPELDRVVFQAFVRAPENMDARDQAAWVVLGNSLLRGTQIINGGDFMRLGSQAGIPPRVIVMGDFLRIELHLPRRGVDVGTALVEAVITAPSLRPEVVEEVARNLQRQRRSVEQIAINPLDLRFRDVTHDDVQNLYTRAFRPENIVVVAGGALERGQVRENLGRRMARWNPETPARLQRRPIIIRPVETTDSSVTIFELSGNPVYPGKPQSGARILALYALGAGKDCTLWRVFREEKAWAYRTEGLLWPTKNGWVPRLLLMRRATANDVDVIPIMREAILADIETWDEATLARASLLAQSSLIREFEFSPWWMSSDGPLTRTFEDRLAWRGYLSVIGADVPDERLLAETFANIDLPGLKEQARKMVEEANASFIPASPMAK
ncbi:MAG: hypothetical protein MUC92_08795 [Fimbriimonadaceae bacterium]|nr:hypothetical protein [Fimbriimonadaceae bacterium]